MRSGRFGYAKMGTLIRHPKEPPCLPGPHFLSAAPVSLRLEASYFKITGSDENADVPMNRSAIATTFVVETQSMVPRNPVSAGNR